MDSEPLITDNEKHDYQEQNPSQEPTNKNNGLSGGAIALIIIGIIFVVGIVIAVILLLTRKPKKN